MKQPLSFVLIQQNADSKGEIRVKSVNMRCSIRQIRDILYDDSSEVMAAVT